MGMMVGTILLVMGFASLAGCLREFLQVQASEETDASPGTVLDAQILNVIYGGVFAVLFLVAGLMVVVSMVK